MNDTIERLKTLTGFDRRRALGILSSLPLLLTARAARSESAQPGEGGEAGPVSNEMALIFARYAELKSYSDTGKVETHYQPSGNPPLIERHKFETAFRAPRNFFFRFDKDPNSGNDAFVIWCDGGSFQSWWKSTGVHTVHDNGQGAVAFFNGGYPTKDSANLAAPLFFPKAKLIGPTSGLIEPKPAGEETVGKFHCRKITANARTTGVVTVEKRPLAVWVDAVSGVIVKVLMDTAAGSGPGGIDRKTFLVEPVVNPALADDRFVFIPPGGKP